MAPHHFTYGALFTLFFCAIVWDNYPEREPMGVVFGILVASFSFLFTWPFYSVVGAAMTLSGLTIATGSILIRDVWKDYPLKWRIATGICILICWDDALEHAFGIPTPLDLIWKHGISQFMM